MRTKAESISDSAVEMYVAGDALELVAEKLGVTYRTARKGLNLRGVEVRDPSTRLLGRTRPDRRSLK
jgi:hypothetical protein